MRFLTKRIFCLFLALFFYVANAHSSVDNSTKTNNSYYYASIDYGVAVLGYNQNKFNTKQPNFDISFGKKFNDYYRLELSIGNRRFNTKDKYRNHILLGGINVNEDCNNASQKYMISNYLDLPKIVNIITPYIMGGIGVSYTRYWEDVGAIAPGKDPVYVHVKTISSYNFAYQFGAGLDIDITDPISLDFSIRHFNPGKTSFSKEESTQYVNAGPRKFRVTEALVGLRYKF